MPYAITRSLRLTPFHSLPHRLQNSFVADEDLRGQNILLLTSLLREVLKVPREKVRYRSVSLYHIILMCIAIL